MKDFIEKNIVVTGCTSGIGLEMVKVLDSEGVNVFAIARNEDKLTKVLGQLRFPERHSAIIIDLKEVESIGGSASLFPEKVHGFVHAAGVESVIPLRNLSYHMMDQIMKVNFYSFLEIVKIIAKQKKVTDDFLTSILAISSIASGSGSKGQTLYSSSKASLEAASVTLSKEFSRKLIRFNTVKPGLVLTEMTTRWMRTAGHSDVSEVSQLQLSGLATVSDVTNVLKFMLSDDSKHIVGTSISLDGGGPKTTLD